MTLSRFVRDDLLRSGIPGKLFPRLGITEHAATSDDEAHYRIPYHDPCGTPRPHYTRRYHPGHDPKYRAKAGSPVQVYFPPLVNWPALLEDPCAPLLVTEGEKKAIAATHAGFPTLALSGVSAFTAKTRATELIPDLEAIDWRGRVVTVIYDNDAATNKDVRTALLRLCLLLAARGADARGTFVPDAENEDLKQGLDDYLLTHSPEELTHVLEHAPRYAPGAHPAVQEFARSHVFLRRRVKMLETEEAEDSVRTRTELCDAYANETIQVVDPLTLRPKIRSVAQVYWESPLRRDAWDTILRPDKPVRSLFTDESGTPWFNTWRGFRVPPKRGSTEPWDKMLRGLLPRREEREWAEDWIAHLLQAPHVKMRSVLCIWSEAQGVGKSSIGDIIGNDLLGDYYWPASQGQLFDRFSAYIEGRLFVMGDDLVFRNNLAEYRAAAKTLFERDANTLEEKYEKKRKVRVICNFYLTGNELAAFPLDPSGTNRRFGLLRGPRERPLPATFYTKTFDRWRADGGAAHLLWKYLHRKIDRFDPNADAIDTDTKAAARSLGRPEHLAWIEEAGERTGLVLATPQALWHRFQQEHPRSSVKRSTFYHYLGLRFPAETHRMTRRLEGRGGKAHVFVILVEDPAPWRRAGTARIRAQLDAQGAPA